MKLILDTNAYVGFKLGYPELVEYIRFPEKVVVAPARSSTRHRIRTWHGQLIRESGCEILF